MKAQEELKGVEEEIDKTVAVLYGITDEELEEIKKILGILKGEDVENRKIGVSCSLSCSGRIWGINLGLY